MVNIELLWFHIHMVQGHTSIYNKSDDFNIFITNFPFLNSNIPSSPVWRFYLTAYTNMT